MCQEWREWRKAGGALNSLPPPLASVLWLCMLLLHIHGWMKSQSSSIAPAADVKLTNCLLQPLETWQSYLEMQWLLMLTLYSSVLTFPPKRPKWYSFRELARFLYSNKPKKKKKAQSRSINSTRILHIYGLYCHLLGLWRLFTTERSMWELKETMPKHTTQKRFLIVLLYIQTTTDIQI